MTESMSYLTDRTAIGTLIKKIYGSGGAWTQGRGPLRGHGWGHARLGMTRIHVRGWHSTYALSLQLQAVVLREKFAGFEQVVHA